ncbi:hypothetical protein [Reichenbachiella ulvae]|uniref:DUF4468 domain-containing protein n=1 Tax=Reichenbachiella ulvae TaxID=2980104 RepID=A0ABT3CP16_9BACT|nr:hypothetical protein [Reichenbachiella ulvae]MCV9385283.1 hypothetical protein [Reichenbachiella ulvae]
MYRIVLVIFLSLSFHFLFAQDVDLKTGLVTYKGSFENTEGNIESAESKIMDLLKEVSITDTLETEQIDGYTLITIHGGIPVYYSAKMASNYDPNSTASLWLKDAKPYGHFNYQGLIKIREGQIHFKFDEFVHHLPKKPKNSCGPIEQVKGHRTSEDYWNNYKMQVEEKMISLVEALEGSLTAETW